jgi:signal transduction histidine kinase
VDVECDDRPAAATDNIGDSGDWPVTAASVSHLLARNESREAWAEVLARAINERGRAECMARIQSDAMQLAIDLLVREPDIAGFFRVFIKTLVEESESHGCGVFLLDNKAPGGATCDLWMAYVQERFFTRGAPDADTLSLPSASMSAHLLAHTPGWTEIVEYEGDDARLPGPVRQFNLANGIDRVLIAPLVLPTRNLGWFALSSRRAPTCEGAWHRALLDAMARQATLALHQSQLADDSRTEARRQAVLEERNRLARDIHDTLAQGFAAILMQLQGAQRAAGSLPAAVARSIETAVDLARTHMVEARRSVGALRPQPVEIGDVGVALERITDLARRGTDVPIELTIRDLPPLTSGADREILGIAQEALTNAVRHANARRIRVVAEGVRSIGFRLSVADDGRGIAKERRGTGFGMTSMQERADRIGASLTVVTAARSGTEVVLAWEPASFAIPDLITQGTREAQRTGERL